MRKLTLADIRQKHTGEWFKNVRSDTSTARIIGGLRRDRYIITYEHPEKHGYYNVWGAFLVGDEYRIYLLAQFISLLLAKAEIADPDNRAPLHQLFIERHRRFITKEIQHDN